MRRKKSPNYNERGAVPSPYLLREYRGGALEKSGALLVTCLHVRVCPKMRERSLKGLIGFRKRQS
ncbi:MAG: hypothetical protein ACFFBD_22540 [Candidatus Hodarchaeota archaeon]